MILASNILALWGVFPLATSLITGAVGIEWGVGSLLKGKPDAASFSLSPLYSPLTYKISFPSELKRA